MQLDETQCSVGLLGVIGDISVGITAAKEIVEHVPFIEIEIKSDSFVFFVFDGLPFGLFIGQLDSFSEELSPLFKSNLLFADFRFLIDCLHLSGDSLLFKTKFRSGR